MTKQHFDQTLPSQEQRLALHVEQDSHWRFVIDESVAETASVLKRSPFGPMQRSSVASSANQWNPPLHSGATVRRDDMRTLWSDDGDN